MTASVAFFSNLVTIALLVTLISPFLLLLFLLRDWKKRTLW